MVIALISTLALTALPLKILGDSSFDLAVDRAVANFFKDSIHVGLSIGIYDNGSVHFYNYGVTSKTRPQKPTSQSLYEIASVTKTFTGALASKALLEGKMSLDSDFRSYLKEAYPNLELNGKPVTLRSLASHTSGLPKDIPDSDALFQHPDFDKLPFQLIASEEPYDTKRYLDELHDVTLSNKPGAKMRYSNIGIKLISFGLENVYGRSYGRLLEDFVIGPLGMKHTGLAVTARDKSRLVQGYSSSDKPMPYHLLNAGAAGGLYSSTEDLIKYVAWQLAEVDPIVKKSHALISGDIGSFGTGLISDETTTADKERKIWHSGGAYGMSSQLILFPDSNVGLVLLANDGGFNSQHDLDMLAMAIRSEQKAK